MAVIELTKGFVAIIDDSDFERLSQFKWCANVVKGGRAYATRNSSTKDGAKKQKIYMHRVILGAAAGLEVDHINGDTLDNRRENLRQCTTSENQMNRGKARHNKSGYKGVCWHKQNKMWRALIKINQKSKLLGYFNSAEDAHQAYCKAAQEIHGKFANVGIDAK